MQDKHFIEEARAKATQVVARLMLCVVLVSLFASCSTQKNTPATRFYHATTARFNTLFNGQQSFLTGMEAQQTGHKENYTKFLPMYISTVPNTATLGKNYFDNAILKSEKAIKLHSIKKRPVIKGNNRRTPEQKEFLARKEFNPYLYRAWLLMAESQFRKGEFIEAASTYHYILRIYSTQPRVASVAKARLARCYVAMGWNYDAEDVLDKMRRDSITTAGQKERDNTLAGYHILTQQYEEAIPYLQRTIKHVKGKYQRTRMNYLLGQLYQETGQNALAYKAYQKVIRSSPPYEMTFNAQVAQTETMPENRFKQMISKLKRMARNDKNKNYLDKVYYAMGNIYLGVQDTTQCLQCWERGVKEGTQNGYDKAMLLLRLSQLYWHQENYIEAARTYKDCMAILDKTHEEYEESDRRSKVLAELAPYLSDIKLQDSLQVLAKMSEDEYLAVIDREIAKLKKEEKEAEKLAIKQGRKLPTSPANNNAGNRPPSNIPRTPTTGRQQRGDWYFYSPQVVRQGIQDFQQRWGNRKNEDYWRLSSMVGQGALSPSSGDQLDDTADANLTDSIGGGEEDAAARAKADSLANDPHHREYYLRQIPFTEEQLEASNQILSDALFHAGILEQEKLENFPLAERTMLRLLADFPERTDLDDIYYHLFLLYGRLGQSEKAEQYRALLLDEYPDTKLAQLLGSPYYEQIASQGSHMEDSLYADAYEAYQRGDYATVEKNYQFSTENFPSGTHRARMMYIRAMSNLYGGERDTFMVTLKELIRKYPSERVTEIANFIDKGLESGRPLMDDRYDASSIWSRRIRAEEGDSTEAPKLDPNRLSNFNFVLVYPTGSLDEALLTYEVARYNFTNYMVRNFDIELRENQGVSMLVTKGFLSYDEVHAYAQQLYADPHMNTVLKGIRTMLISDDNLQLIGREFSFDDYKEFYDRELVPLDVPDDLKIDQPTDIEFIDPEEVDPAELEQEQSTEEEMVPEVDDFPYGF